MTFSNACIMGGIIKPVSTVLLPCNLSLQKTKWMLWLCVLLVTEWGGVNAEFLDNNVMPVWTVCDGLIKGLLSWGWVGYGPLCYLYSTELILCSHYYESMLSFAAGQQGNQRILAVLSCQYLRSCSSPSITIRFRPNRRRGRDHMFGFRIRLTVKCKCQ